MADLRRQIRGALDLHEMTYGQLALRMGLSPSSMHRKLHGARPIKLAELEAMAKHLGLELVLKRKFHSGKGRK